MACIAPARPLGKRTSGIIIMTISRSKSKAGKNLARLYGAVVAMLLPMAIPVAPAIAARRFHMQWVWSASRPAPAPRPDCMTTIIPDDHWVAGQCDGNRVAGGRGGSFVIQTSQFPAQLQSGQFISEVSILSSARQACPPLERSQVMTSDAATRN